MIEVEEQFICSKAFTDINIKFSYNSLKNCCKSKDYFPTSEEILQKGKNFFLEDIELLKRRQSMAKLNQLPEACNSCTKTHPNSLFKVWNEWRNPMEQEQKDLLLTEDRFHLFELVLGNNCDLACVYCSEKDSTRWANEKKIPAVRGNKDWEEVVLRTFFTYLEKKVFIPTQQYYFFFSGGEPTYIPQTIPMIQKIISCVPNEQLNLVMTTNINAREEIFDKYLQLVDQNAAIRWRFDCSMDGIQERAEAIRYGLVWSRALRNIRELNKRKNVDVSINSTLSVFSVPTFSEFLKFFTEIFSEQNRKPLFGANMVMEEHFSVRLLPKTFKKYLNEAIQYVQQNEVLNKKEFLTHLQNIENLIGTDQEAKSIENLKGFIQFFRVTRPKVNYLELFPHIGDLINSQTYEKDY